MTNNKFYEGYMNFADFCSESGYVEVDFEVVNEDHETDIYTILYDARRNKIHKILLNIATNEEEITDDYEEAFQSLSKKITDDSEIVEVIKNYKENLSDYEVWIDYIKEQIKNWTSKERNAETVTMLEDAIQAENPRKYVEEITVNGYQGTDETLSALYAAYAVNLFAELADMEEELQNDVENNIVVECYVCEKFKHYEETNWGEQSLVDYHTCYECLENEEDED